MFYHRSICIVVEKYDFSVRDTAGSEQQIQVLPIGAGPMNFWLLSPDVLTLSYKRLVEAKATKLGLIM